MFNFKTNGGIIKLWSSFFNAPRESNEIWMKGIMKVLLQINLMILQRISSKLCITHISCLSSRHSRVSVNQFKIRKIGLRNNRFRNSRLKRIESFWPYHLQTNIPCNRAFLGRIFCKPKLFNPARLCPQGIADISFMIKIPQDFPFPFSSWSFSNENLKRLREPR